MSVFRSGWRSGPGTTLLVAIAVACAFFGIEHLPDASIRPDYAPDAETMAQAHEQGDMLRRVGILGLAGLGAAGVWLGTAGRRSAGGLLGGALILWAAWPFVSVLWSETPLITLRKTITFALSLWAAAGVAKLLSGRQLVWAALIAVVAQFGFGVLTELVLGTFRPWAGNYRFAGTIHPNMQALQLCVGAVACTALLLRPGTDGSFSVGGRGTSRWAAIRGPLLIALGITLALFCLLTKSRTSAGGLVAAVAAVAVFLSSAPTKNLLAVGGVWLAATALIGLMLTGLDPTDDIRDAALMGRAEDSGSLSGRVQIWEALDGYVAERPLLGYGYLTFWSERHLYALHAEVDFKFSGAHSAWYETALGLGAPGVMLLGVVLFGGMVRAAIAEGTEQRTRGTIGSPLPAFLFGVLALAALNSLLEAIIADVRLTPFLMICGLVKVTFFPDAAPAFPRPSSPHLPPAVRPEAGDGL